MSCVDSSAQAQAQTITQVLFLKTTAVLQFLSEVLFVSAPFCLLEYAKDMHSEVKI